MSRWLTDELHVSLSPSQVEVTQIKRSLGIKGIMRELIARRTVACDADTQGQGWDSAMRTLDGLLAEYSATHPNISITLSNHLVRYTLVPWSDLVTGDEQLQAYTRHCFHSTYGAMSATWALRLSRASVGAAQLASAIEQKLLDACHEGVKRHGLRLISVQPYLMSAFNQFKLQLQEHNSWFALAEPGMLCLAQLHEGEWVRFRTVRQVDSWEALSRLLIREAFMGEGDLQITEQLLYLYAPHLGRAHSLSGWKIIELPTPLSKGWNVEIASNQVVAISEPLGGNTNA